MNDGLTVKAAYEGAMADYPQCWPNEGPCMRFAGDEEFTVVPVVKREFSAFLDIPPEIDMEIIKVLEPWR
jgi:hypothetical protein